MLGLVFKWFPLFEISPFDTPWVSSLIVQGLGISALTPKAQGLISGQEQRFHKWFVMAPSEIKTNTKKTRNQRGTAGRWQLQNQANNN